MIVLFDRGGPDWKSDAGRGVTSQEELRTAVEGLSRGNPRIFELVSSTGTILQLGLGGPYACAQFIEPIPGMPGARSAWMASAETPLAPNEVEFMFGGTPTPVVPQYCLSLQEALRISKHFQETGRRQPDVKWDQFC